MDSALDICALTGLAISLVVLVTGAANSVSLIVIWLFYHSLVNVGQQWYSFGWESQVNLIWTVNSSPLSYSRITQSKSKKQ